MKQGGHRQSTEHSYLCAFPDPSLVPQPLLQSKERALCQSHPSPQFCTHVISGADGASQAIESLHILQLSVSDGDWLWVCVGWIILHHHCLPLVYDHTKQSRDMGKFLNGPVHGTVGVCRQSCIVCRSTVQHLVQPRVSKPLGIRDVSISINISIPSSLQYSELQGKAVSVSAAMYNMKSTGPSTDPCQTPVRMWNFPDSSFLYWTQPSMSLWRFCSAVSSFRGTPCLVRTSYWISRSSESNTCWSLWKLYRRWYSSPLPSWKAGKQQRSGPL